MTEWTSTTSMLVLRKQLGKSKIFKPEQVKEIWPLCTEGLVGAIQHPEDGYIQPADLTQALATVQEIMELKFIETQHYRN